MEKKTVPYVYYGFSRDFSYRRYLEERSHADHIVLAIDQATQGIVGSADSIARNLRDVGVNVSAELSAVNQSVIQGSETVANSIDELQGAVAAGFSELTFELSEIGGNIDNLNSICEAGFELINSSIIHSNVLLNQLVSLIETPEQVWAKEQYDSALHCVENDLWIEAIEYCTKAIDGDERHAGHKLEPTFHFLRGTVYLGGGGADPDIVDLSNAILDFSNCARYCGKNNSKLRRKAINNAAWAKYCDGAADEAISLLLKSAPPNQTKESAESSFLLAKFFLHKADTRSAEQHFKSAIVRDELFAVRAVNDPDFVPHMEKVRSWMEDVRKDLRAHITAVLNEKILHSEVERLADFSQGEGIGLPQWKGISEEIAAILLPSASLTDRVNFLDKRLGKLREVARMSVSDTLESLEKKAEKLITAVPRTVVPHDKRVTASPARRSDTTSKWIGLGLAAGIVFAFVTTYLLAHNEGFWYFVDWFFGLLIFGVIGIVGGVVIGSVIGWVMGFVSEESRISAENRKHLDRQNQAAKQRKIEQKEINADVEVGKELMESVEGFRSTLRPLLEAR